jgi:hypothetical protein
LDSETVAGLEVNVEYVVGIGLALLVSVAARLAGFDRDRVFYPMLLAVIASYYVLFAVMGGSRHALIVESLIMAVFLIAAGIGFRFSLWVAVAALAAHGVQDFFHASVVTNPGVPAWWPGFCGAYDVTAAGFLAFLSARIPMRR